MTDATTVYLHRKSLWNTDIEVTPSESTGVLLGRLEMPEIVFWCIRLLIFLSWGDPCYKSFKNLLRSSHLFIISSST